MSIDSSTKREATWLLALKPTLKPPMEYSRMLSSAEMRASRDGRGPARRRPYANSLAAMKPSMLEKLACTDLPPSAIAVLNSRAIGRAAL